MSERRIKAESTSSCPDRLDAKRERKNTKNTERVQRVPYRQKDREHFLNLKVIRVSYNDNSCLRYHNFVQVIK